MFGAKTQSFKVSMRKSHKALEASSVELKTETKHVIANCRV